MRDCRHLFTGLSRGNCTDTEVCVACGCSRTRTRVWRDRLLLATVWRPPPSLHETEESCEKCGRTLLEYELTLGFCDVCPECYGEDAYCAHCEEPTDSESGVCDACTVLAQQVEREDYLRGDRISCDRCASPLEVSPVFVVASRPLSSQRVCGACSRDKKHCTGGG